MKRNWTNLFAVYVAFIFVVLGCSGNQRSRTPEDQRKFDEYYANAKHEEKARNDRLDEEAARHRREHEQHLKDNPQLTAARDEACKHGNRIGRTEGRKSQDAPKLSFSHIAIIARAAADEYKPQDRESWISCFQGGFIEGYRGE
jgi:hypothetical protein